MPFLWLFENSHQTGTLPTATKTTRHGCLVSATAGFQSLPRGHKAKLTIYARACVACATHWFCLRGPLPMTFRGGLLELLRRLYNTESLIFAPASPHYFRPRTMSLTQLQFRSNMFNTDGPISVLSTRRFWLKVPGPQGCRCRGRPRRTSGGWHSLVSR